MDFTAGSASQRSKSTDKIAFIRAYLANRASARIGPSANGLTVTLELCIACVQAVYCVLHGIRCTR